MIDYQTHFKGCWQDPRKHPSCALDRIAHLEAENEDQRKVIDMLAEQDGLVIAEIRRQQLRLVRCWMVGCAEIGDLDARVMNEMDAAGAGDEWLPIESAPKDGTEILGWRDDCGLMIVRWTAPIEFAAPIELETLDEVSTETYDWFAADFIQGCRLEGDEAPTHWMPLPTPPKEPSHD